MTAADAPFASGLDGDEPDPSLAALPVRRADILSRPDGLLFLWIKAPVLPASIWKDARPLVILGPSSFKVGFRRYAGADGEPSFILVVDVASPRTLFAQTLMQQRWVDVVFVDRDVDPMELDASDILNVLASVTLDGA